MPKLKEKTIFKSYLFWTLEEEDEQKKALKEIMEEDAICDGCDVDLSDDAIDNRFHEDIWQWYDDERLNLNKTLPNKIIAIGTVGVWTGNHNGAGVIGNNLNDILSFRDCDDLSITYDRYNVHGIFAHHDGRHYMTFREVKEGVDVDRLIQIQVYEGGLTPQQITRYTKSLVPYVKAIYGA